MREQPGLTCGGDSPRAPPSHASVVITGSGRGSGGADAPVQQVLVPGSTSPGLPLLGLEFDFIFPKVTLPTALPWGWTFLTFHGPHRTWWVQVSNHPPLLLAGLPEGLLCVPGVWAQESDPSIF